MVHHKRGGEYGYTIYVTTGCSMNSDMTLQGYMYNSLKIDAESDYMCDDIAHLVISLDDVSAVCLVLEALGLAVVQALYVIGGYPISADSAPCDGGLVCTYVWDPRVDFSERVDKLFMEGPGLGAVGGATYAVDVIPGEGVETSQAAGDMYGSIFDDCLCISLWWQLWGLLEPE